MGAAAARAGELSDDALLAVAAGLAGEPLSVLRALPVGGNNRLYRVEGRSRSYALKRYPQERDDARARYEREFGGLSFLWQQGERRIPEPLGLDPESAVGLYGWVEGERPATPGMADVDALADFARDLDELARRPGAAHLPSAREAVLARAELEAQLAERLARLERESAREPGLAALLADIAGEIRKRSGGPSARLTPAEQTLSPSDFGFHNALQRLDRLVFVDFEYFGWDDPVKLTADVLWHPGMALDAPLRRKFFARATDSYDVHRSFRVRFEHDAPLYGLRWALIVLNVFLPEAWGRRIAAGVAGAIDVLRPAQLAKAAALVERVRHDRLFE